MSSQRLCFCVTIIALGICSHGIITALASLASVASPKHKQKQSRSHLCDFSQHLWPVCIQTSYECRTWMYQLPSRMQTAQGRLSCWSPGRPIRRAFRRASPCSIRSPRRALPSCRSVVKSAASFCHVMQNACYHILDTSIGQATDVPYVVSTDMLQCESISISVLVFATTAFPHMLSLPCSP